ncbi:MAG: SPFH domain-containing protein [Chloroflexota bacterium]|nr:SPFH domain-containing protein [Dehalococcoidia bacterium]MDW8255018.1 SPFH domain-containing protein [Chloroflexota bacterium]
MELLSIAIIAVVLVVVFFLLVSIAARLYRVVGPNRALIIYGLGGTQIVTGGGRVVLPLVQNAQELSLELMSFDVAPTQDLYTSQGVAVRVEAVTQIKVKSDPSSIRTAAEQFLTKPPAEREAAIRLVMEGHLRGMVGQLTVEQIVKEPEMIADRVRATSAEDMAKMGLEVVSFTIREITDKNEYIANMGRPDIARIKRDADVATAEAQRDTAIRQAETMREAAIARAQADQQRVIAETASLAVQAEAQRDLETKRAEYQAAVQRAKAAADAAYEIEANIQKQRIIAEQVAIERVQREELVKVQEAEIQRRERELIATVQKPAEAERAKVLTLAEAEKRRLELEALGRAESIRAEGLAEAEVIRAKGEAEAIAMARKASAFHEYNQAAIVDKLLSELPEIVRALAEPLTKVDKITVVSTGSDGARGVGINQLTTDMAQVIAQVPALVETLTGLKLEELMRRLPQLRDSAAASMPTSARTDGKEQ